MGMTGIIGIAVSTFMLGILTGFAIFAAILYYEN